VQNYFTQNFSSREISRFSASIFLAVILAVLAGCGSGGMNSNPVSTTTSGTTVALATLSASQTTVSAGQSSIITATVTGAAPGTVTSGTGAALSGQTVTFSLPVTGSGAPTLSAASVVTDSSGNAVTVYTSGVGSPTDTVNDAIQATLTNGSSKAVIVTRSNQAATANAVALTSSCLGVATSFTVLPSNSCVVTATVKNASGSAISGIVVTFATVVSGTGAVLPPVPPVPGINVTTDSSGNAITTYTAGGTPGKSDVITATITGGNAAIVITD
jgi:hypothetical protein